MKHIIDKQKMHKLNQCINIDHIKKQKPINKYDTKPTPSQPTKVIK